jgi:hypothetical protein
MNDMGLEGVNGRLNEMMRMLMIFPLSINEEEQDFEDEDEGVREEVDRKDLENNVECSRIDNFSIPCRE